MLSALGLTRQEEQAYRYLIERASGTVDELAVASEADANDAAHVLAMLEDKGLIARTSTDRDRYVASPPSVALGALLVQRQEDLRRAQAGMTELMGRYRGAGRDVGEVVDVVHGVEAIAQRFAQLQLSARHRIQTLSKKSAAVVTNEENVDTERTALSRGVTYQAVFERAEFDDPGFHELVESAVDAGVEVGVVSDIPLRMLLVDREIALVPLVPGSSEERVVDALLVHPSGLLDGLLALSDTVWASSTQIRGGETGIVEVSPHQLDEGDAQVLELLLVGLTDQTIGAQLGMSLRTVQRRVRQMMDRAGVDTRLQLGFEASRRGWA